MPDVTRTEGDPHDRLTRLAGAALEAIDASPDYQDGDQAIVFLSVVDGDGFRGGTAMLGYDDDTEAVADMLVHLKAVMEANGQTLMVVPVGEG